MSTRGNVVRISWVIFAHFCGTNFFGSCVNDEKILKLPNKTNSIIYITELKFIHKFLQESFALEFICISKQFYLRNKNMGGNKAV